MRFIFVSKIDAATNGPLHSLFYIAIVIANWSKANNLACKPIAFGIAYYFKAPLIKIFNQSYHLSVSAHGGLVHRARYSKFGNTHLFYGVAPGVKDGDIASMYNQYFSAWNRTEYMAVGVVADTDDLPARIVFN